MATGFASFSQHKKPFKLALTLKIGYFLNQMRKIVFLTLFIWAGLYGVFKFFESSERYLKKKTELLIHLVSFKGVKTDMSLISKASQIDQYIHHNVQLNAQYQSRIYQARSLNELRSLLLAYFRSDIRQKIEYENLKVQIQKGQKKAKVLFSVAIYNTDQTLSCNVLLNWLKDKKWFIKKIELKNCREL